jgi:mannitol-1-phosphate 5-dehydrogenase
MNGDKKIAVMIGAGNIGRGFVGAAFAASGYETVFIRRNEELVNSLNARGSYPVRILLPDGSHTETIVSGIRAINSANVREVATEIAHADICATAVGVRALPDIVESLALGLAIRVREGGAPLNIIVCENLIDAGEKLREYVREYLPPDIAFAADSIAGYPEAVIGRMVPIQTEEMMDGDPLRVCVEKYGFLPVDKAAFEGPIPKIEGMIPLDHFEYYVKRKLFIHNLGHAAAAFLGLLKGYTYIYEAVDDAEILCVVQGAMQESAAALNKENPWDSVNLKRHIDSLLYRFSNRSLKDTCERVAADPLRKLGKNDRIIGAIENCESYGLPVFCIAAVAAAAAIVLEKTGDKDNAPPPLTEITGLAADSGVFRTIMTFGTAAAGAVTRGGDAVAALRRAAMKLSGDINIL